MLAEERLDIVSVCTTARLRPIIVQDVARAGVKAIWAEKPISLSLKEADDMIDCLQRTRGSASGELCAPLEPILQRSSTLD